MRGISEERKQELIEKYPTLGSLEVEEYEWELIDTKDLHGRRITIHNMAIEKFAALTKRQQEIVLAEPTLAVGWDTGAIQKEDINAYDIKLREREEEEKRKAEEDKLNQKILRAEKQQEKQYYQRMRVIIRYGGICKCCGEWRKTMLDVHHRHPRQHPDKGSRARFYAWMDNQNEQLKEYQVLCANCYDSIRRNNGHCEHVTEQDEVRLVTSMHVENGEVIIEILAEIRGLNFTGPDAAHYEDLLRQEGWPGKPAEWILHGDYLWCSLPISEAKRDWARARYPEQWANWPK